MNSDKKTIEEEFISTLSHEIRTPLTSIKGFSQTMINSWDKLNDDKKKEFLNIILSQSQRLINLVENVLNVAKIDSNNNGVILSKVDITNLVNNCINIVSINNKNFDFEFIKSNNDIYSLADIDKLQQIIINIMDNAVKYSQNSNKIVINTSFVDDYNLISIKNFGSFIDIDDQKKVFDKFYRVDSYIHSSTQGSGLGLYIAYNLAKKMQCDIKINSSKEKNYCEFLIYVPVYNVEKMTKNIGV